MVIPRFVGQALAGEPITVCGDGTQTRSFGYVGDIVGAVVQLMNHPAAVGEVFNIGNTEEISMNELALLVKEMTGSRLEIVHVPYSQAYEEGFEDMPRRMPDISRVAKLVGYRPTVDIRAILQSVIDYMAENGDAAAPSVLRAGHAHARPLRRGCALE